LGINPEPLFSYEYYPTEITPIIGIYFQPGWLYSDLLFFVIDIIVIFSVINIVLWTLKKKKLPYISIVLLVLNILLIGFSYLALKNSALITFLVKEQRLISNEAAIECFINSNNSPLEAQSVSYGECLAKTNPNFTTEGFATACKQRTEHQTIYCLNKVIHSTLNKELCQHLNKPDRVHICEYNVYLATNFKDINKETAVIACEKLSKNRLANCYYDIAFHYNDLSFCSKIDKRYSKQIEGCAKLSK
jgi:hypothetical protein